MSGSSGSGPLVPTFNGFVQNSMDGLVLFEACLSGKLHHVPRRPHDRERSSLIKSGNIFIYEENASGIKRWTDGVAWSPSRILGNFLIYRELERPFPPGEKKRAMKRKRSSQLDGQPGRRDSEENDTSEVNMPPTPPSPKPQPPQLPPQQQEAPLEPGQDNERELERQLIGSLVDSYGFRPDGLVKKTMSISINGVSHHLVSYYKLDDVKNRALTRPLNDPRLSGITVRPELYLKQNFRTPVEETEHYVVDPSNMHAHPGMSYGPMMGGYGMRPGSYMPQGYGMYGMPATTGGMYASTPATAWAGSQPPAMSTPYAAQPYPTQAYGDYYNRAPAQPSQPPAMKSEEQQVSAPPSYNHFSNPTPFQARPTSGSFSAYQSPMRPQSSGYGSNSQASPAVYGSNTQTSPSGYGSTAHTTSAGYGSNSHTSSAGYGASTHATSAGYAPNHTTSVYGSAPHTQQHAQHTSPNPDNGHHHQHSYSSTPTQSHSFEHKMPTPQYGGHNSSAGYGANYGTPAHAAYDIKAGGVYKG